MADEKTPNPGDLPPSDIKPVSITDELSRSYLDYAMSVIVARALPDVRDGLKPVHRRILYSMHENGYEWNKPYRKSARVVGDVIGKYHPHGDQSVYDALVRMAQDFSMRVELVDGQGNFGSVDGDPPAAMRYTEVRLRKISDSLVDDLDKQTVDYQDNYDGSEREPVVLPAKFPNLLVNGAGGIAVGMATNIPPHNLGEVIDACVAYIDKPDITLEELTEIVPGPDFPTGGIILGKNGIRQAYHLGRGSIMVRGRVAIERDKRDRESIIITEIPYQVNKASMIERIAELVRDKKIDGIGDIRDESSRDGMRVVIELKREAISEIVLNQLYRFTALQSSFPANIVALSGGRPATMNLHDLVSAFVAFREEVIGRRTKFLLNKARDRAHILVGLAIAVANIDEVIKLIRSAKDPQTAREQLMAREWPAKDVKALVELIDDPRHKVSANGTYFLSDEQARAILDLRLQRLTALGRDEIEAELDTLGKEIAEYLEILRSRARIQSIIKTELSGIKKEFATPRKTEISGEEIGEIDEEALITPEDMVVTVSHAGYVKRVPLSTYRAQRRGGKGRAGMQTREEDFVSRLFVASTHDEVLFFSSRGRAYTLKVWKLPLAAPQARGKAFVNLLPIQPDEAITSIITMPADSAERDKLNIMFATTAGGVRRNALSDFVDIRRSGIIAMKLAEGEAIADVALCTDADDVLLSTDAGQCIRFPVGDVRVFKGRDSSGVRGIKLDESDKLISMAIIRHMEATSEERVAYLKLANAVRRGEETEAESDDEEKVGAIELSQQRYAEMGAAEQFILTLTDQGYGKRTSSFEYRITGRGGKGIVAMSLGKKNGRVVGSFPVEESDQIMLVTDAGKLIRTPVAGIRIAGRSTQGVIVFDTADDEKVVSVERIREDDENGS
ncbi:MAG: DNA gyrase subunit A [Xanthobacteraceae bacterium]|nr:DNA gyrase subunit A [Xanthobacteraceae bacterium]MCW5677146.1 DNA gyrase subunit A [Xanthobacteraceae bacterium]